jgi:hypothetical protein
MRYGTTRYHDAGQRRENFMYRALISSAFAFLVLTLPALTNAHHSMDPGDGTPIELTGTIDYISWDGAHVMYRIRSREETGETKVWQVLGASPKILSERHITKSTMRIGERITVNGSYNASRQQIAPYFFSTADGQKYEMGFYPPKTKSRKQ